MRKLFILFTFLFVSTYGIAQNPKDSLKTQEIIVVKPYTPTIKNAFKINSGPKALEVKGLNKQPINYSIFSFPVASTFTPSKGKAKAVNRGKRERLFRNYISAGFGNYTSPFLESYLNGGDQKYTDFGAFIQHKSAHANIEDSALNSTFSKSKIDGFYKQYDRDYNWQINGGLNLATYNYYGLAESENFTDSFLDPLDEKQSYATIYAGGKFNLFDSFFKGVSLELMHFSDLYNSSEFRTFIKPSLEFPLSTESIGVDFSIDYSQTSFDQVYTVSESHKYSYLNLGASPNFEVLRNDFTLNLGAKVYYTFDLESDTSTFLAYPNIVASLKVVDELLMLTAGVTGDLQQNTYKKFAEENPYISPTQNIQQTDNQYNIFFGAKGKLSSHMHYDISASYSKALNSPLYILNQTLSNGLDPVEEVYQLGNSFSVIYDDISTLALEASMEIKPSEQFEFKGTVLFNSHNLDLQQEAWNIPSLQASISGKYNSDKWYAGVQLYMRGKTKDYLIPFEETETNGIIIENESFLDLNIDAGYHFSDRLILFGKIDNAFGKSYEQFTNYKVQSLQVSGGLTYKFDLN